jgi:hypothetical protein
MRFLFYIALPLIFAHSGLAQNAVPIRGCVIIKQKCKAQIKQTKFGFSFGGIDFTSGTVSKVGAVSLSTDLLQKLTNVAQIMDFMQLNNCQLLNSITTCDASRQDILRTVTAGNIQLTQLAFLAEMYSSNPDKLQDAMLKWITQSTVIFQRLTANQNTGADPKTVERKADAKSALEFALHKLSVSLGSPGFNEIVKENLVLGPSQ